MEIITTITTFILIPLVLLGVGLFGLGCMLFGAIEKIKDCVFDHKHKAEKQELNEYLQVVDDIQKRINSFKPTFIHVNDMVTLTINNEDADFKYIGVGRNEDMAFEDENGHAWWLSDKYLYDKSKNMRKEQGSKYNCVRCDNLRKRLDDGSYATYEEWKTPLDAYIEELLKKANDILNSDPVRNNMYYRHGMCSLENSSKIQFCDTSKRVAYAIEETDWTVPRLTFNSPAEAAAYAKSTNVNKL